NKTREYQYTNITTYDFISPELLMSYQVSKKTDIWSLGLIFYFIFTGRYLINTGFYRHRSQHFEHMKMEIHNKIQFDPIFFNFKDKTEIEDRLHLDDHIL